MWLQTRATIYDPSWNQSGTLLTSEIETLVQNEPIHENYVVPTGRANAQNCSIHNENNYTPTYPVIQFIIIQFCEEKYYIVDRVDSNKALCRHFERCVVASWNRATQVIRGRAIKRW